MKVKELPEENVVRTCCNGCHQECGVLVHVKDGKVVTIEGDPNHPLNEGMMCPKGLSYIQHLYHPDRIMYPMKRTGERGEGKWQRISWDEALDTIASKFLEIKKTYGPEALAFTWGMVPRGGFAGYVGLFQGLGSPNATSTDCHYCYTPSYTAQVFTLGSGPPVMMHVGPDSKNTNCDLVWGGNPISTEPPFARDTLRSKANRGTKLIVVDPRFTPLAARADIWLQLRPGTDDALVLGMLNVIINEGLYDREFVDKWCFGFEKLKERVQKYPPEVVSDITWVSADKIRQAARMYATTKPAALRRGVAGDQIFNGFQASRAMAIMIAITGNFDVKGGTVVRKMPPGFLNVYKMFTAREVRMPREMEEKRIGAKEFPLLSGPDSVRGFAHPPLLIKAMLTGEPYQIRGLYSVNNLIMSLENSYETYEALKKLDFFVVADFFMTPTAELADIVLAPATWLEREEVCEYFYTNFIAARQKVIEPLGECRDEWEIVLDLANRMDVQIPFIPEEVRSAKQFSDYKLKEMGITFDEFQKIGYIIEPMTYKKYEQEGFKTPTGKVELYSTILEKYGYDPLPNYVEGPETPISTPELAKEYPLILTAGRRHIAYYHSMGRQIPYLRELAPDPTIEINTETANRLGIKDGDWVWIETPTGKGRRIKHKARLTLGLHPMVVQPESQWWFPEKREPDHGCWESNINVLLSNDPPYGDVCGTVVLRSLLCKIGKVEED